MPPWSVVALVVAVNVSFFFIGGGLFHILIHRGCPLAVARRRHQPNKRQTWAMMRRKVPLVLLNGILLNAIVGAGIAFSTGPWGAAYWHSPRHGFVAAALSTVALFFFYHFALFYFHRAMHRPRLFRAFHHLHHRFKAPMFLDALYEHPVELLYGALVLVTPLFLFPVNLYGYLLFFAIVGVHRWSTTRGSISICRSCRARAITTIITVAPTVTTASSCRCSTARTAPFSSTTDRPAGTAPARSDLWRAAKGESVQVEPLDESQPIPFRPGEGPFRAKGVAYRGHHVVERLAALQAQYFDFAAGTVELIGERHILLQRPQLPALLAGWTATVLETYVDVLLTRAGAKSVLTRPRPLLPDGQVRGVAAVKWQCDITWQ